MNGHARGRGRVVFLSGEPDTVGHRYRVVRTAQAAEDAGFTTHVVRRDRAQEHLDLFGRADILFIWRAWWDAGVAAAVAATREGGGVVVFDIDDLLVEPDLATYEQVDGLRSQGAPEQEMRGFFAGFERTLASADFCSAPTPLLVARMSERHGKPGFLLPNTFDAEVLARSRAAVEARQAMAPDGLTRIGYAAGTRTHQRDFQETAGALAEVMAARPWLRLVLFRDGDRPLIQLDEFPVLEPVLAQVEWRQMQPLSALPDELARFDVNIAPLQHGNLFCEAKSELKYFEAALVGTPTVASPTEPYRLAIVDGRTGFLAAEEAGWRKALATLVDDSAARRAMGEAACQDSLARFGPEARQRSFTAIAEAVSAAKDRGIVRAPPPAPSVSVIVPVFNVEPYLAECLAGVTRQTHHDLEVIVVDDGSTDGSPAIVAEAAARDARIVVVTQPNRGLSAARNAGLARARGEYVCFVDSDDAPRLRYVEALLAAARRTGAPVVSCAIDYLNADGSLSFHSTFHTFERVAPYIRDGVVDLRDKRILAEFFPSAWNKLYHRSLFAELRFPEGLYYEDHPVFFAVGCAVDRWAYMPEALYVQRRERPSSITSERSPRVFDVLQILQLVHRVLTSHVPPPASLKMFKQVALRLLWERSNSISDLALFEDFMAAGARLLHDTGVSALPPQAQDPWIPSAVGRRLRLGARQPAQPFCSIVVTYADDAAFFGQFLEELANQALWDIEVILVDNGARDGSDAIAAERCAADRRFRQVRHEGRSLGGARNLGLDHARGEFVAFFEANDLVRPDGLERLFSYGIDEGADVVLSGFDYVRPHGPAYHSGTHRPLEPITLAGHPAKLILPPGSCDLVADFLALPGNKLFRRRFLTQHGLRFDAGGYFEEHAFWSDVSAHEPRVYYSSEPLCRVRDEPAARRIWSGAEAAWDCLGAIAALRGRLDRPLWAKLAVRLAWERLSFSLTQPAARARFGEEWRAVTADLSAAELRAARDDYIGEDFMDRLLDGVPAMAAAP